MASAVGAAEAGAISASPMARFRTGAEEASRGIERLARIRMAQHRPPRKPAGRDDSFDSILTPAPAAFNAVAGASAQPIPIEEPLGSFICEAKRVELGVPEVEPEPHRLAGLDLFGQVF